MKPRKRVFLYEYQQAHSDLAIGTLVVIGSFALGLAWFLAGVPA